MTNLTPIAPNLAASGPTTLVFKEKKGLTLTGDSGKVLDKDGNVVFEVDAHAMTMSERRTLKDASGAKIGQVRKKKTPGLHAACYIGTMDDEKKCMVKVKGMLNPIKCDADIYIGDEVVGEATGNWRAKTFTVTMGGNQVATVTRKTGITGHLFDADSYFIEVADGLDTAFASMVVIALDELYHDDDY